MKEISLSGENLYNLIESVFSRKLKTKVKIQCRGFSMSPFIKDKDTVVIKAIDSQTHFSVGDIVAVINSIKKRAIIHRIIRIKKDLYQIKGDNLINDDGWYSKKNIIGIIDSVAGKETRNFTKSLRLNKWIALGSRSGLLNRVIFPILRSLKTLIPLHYD